MSSSKSSGVPGPRHRCRRFHRAPSRGVSQGTGILGKGSRSEAPRICPYGRGRIPASRSTTLGELSGGHVGNRRSLRTGGGHGRNGFHLPPSRADSPQQHSDQHTHARRRAREWRSSLSVHVVGLCLSRVSAGRYERRATSRGTRVPGCTTRRIWMGETDYGATLRTLPGRLRYGNADRPVPQHIRAVRNLGWGS